MTSFIWYGFTYLESINSCFVMAAIFLSNLIWQKIWKFFIQSATDSYFWLKKLFFIRCLVNESPSDWFWSLFFVIRYGLQFRTSHLSWYAWCLLRQKRLVKSTIQFSRCVFGGQKRRIKLALRLDFNPPRKTSLWNEFSVSLYLIFLPSNLMLTPK